MTASTWTSFSKILAKNFLGNSPGWYKLCIALFLTLNAGLWALSSIFPTLKFVVGWLVLIEFIFTLAMALRCYPLQPGGLLALEAVLLGMTSPKHVYHELANNLEVLLLLLFMVAGIYFMRDLLAMLFRQLLLAVRSRTVLALLFTCVSAVMSAFLDALTVTAVLIAISVSFYRIYYEVAAGLPFELVQLNRDAQILSHHKESMAQFCAFLRGLLMHGLVGTALGGVCTIVGEPQNLLIATKMGWNFGEFFFVMLPVTLPVFISGLALCLILEKMRWKDFGVELPETTRAALMDYEKKQRLGRKPNQIAQLWLQGVVLVLLVISLAFHIAPVGLIGLGVIVLASAFNGVTEEHRIAPAFEEATPFIALLAVFFVIVSMIHDLHLFTPLLNWVLTLQADLQTQVFFIICGLLSVISDNVFVATIYINQIEEAFKQGLFDRAHMEQLAVAINTGTNIPSVGTPNGQAAFLFILTSQLAPLIGLSYARMCLLALPYTIVLSIVAITAVALWL